MRIVAVVLLALVFGASLAAAAEPSPELAAIIAGAKSEGRLDLSWSEGIIGGADSIATMHKDIADLFGVDLDIQYAPGPAPGMLGNKLRTEFQVGQKASTDIWIGTPQQVAPLLGTPMFRTIDWPKLLPGRITPAIVEADGRALRFATSMPGILYNLKLAPQAAEVKATEDLLKPEWKGKFATPPYISGYEVLAAESVWGEERALDFMRKLSTQVQGLLNCGGEARLASGEFTALAMDCGGSGPNLKLYRGILGLQVIPDNAQRRLNYLLVPANASHPNAATLATVYFSTERGQALVRDLWGLDLYDYPESLIHAEMTALEKQGVTFRDITITWWLQQPHLAEISAKMAKIFTEAR